MATVPGGDEAPDIGAPNKGATFKLQGHTASHYGSDPTRTAQGVAGESPRDLSPNS